jgi:very-short-patch-repair endonuclease
MHRSQTLLPAVVTLHRGIPVTTPARTIADLRRIVAVKDPQGVFSAKALRRAIRQADVLGLPIGPEPGLDRTRSELERDFLRLCRRSDLPAPEVNVQIGSVIVDFLWREQRLIVETDGYRYHRGRSAFEADRDRDLRLRALGYEVIRLSYRQVVDEPQPVAAALKKLLG